MNKIQALIIRACKSNSTEYRLKRIYESVYYGQYDPKHMLVILLEIVEKYELIRLRNLVRELNPENAWKFGASVEDSYEQRACKVLISVIRLTEVSKFEGYPKPCKFKEKA